MKILHVCALLLATSAIALGEPSTSQNCKVSGFVLQDPGGQPIRKADVQLLGTEGQGNTDYQTLTGPEGNFTISDVAPGQYRLIVRRDGFLPRKHTELLTGQILSLTAGQTVERLVVKMQPTGVITGAVTDRDGDPLPGTAVHAIIYYPSASHGSGFSPLVLTNDLGEYRISDLAPGKYLILAVAREKYQLVSPQGHSASQDQEKPYPTYYPGTFDRDQAIPLDLHPGEQTSADISILSGPVFDVHGSVSSPSVGRFGESLALVPADGLLPTSFDTAQIRPDGTFDLHDVLPGHYAAQLMSVNDAGQVEISSAGNVDVKDTNVENVQLSEIPPSRIVGALRVEGRSSYSPTKYYVTLTPSDDSAPIGIPLGVGVRKDGSFEFINVPPGTYQAMVWAQSAKKLELFVKSVSVSGRNITDEGVVTRGGTYPIDIVASTQCPHIEGAVSTDNGLPSPEATVIAIPEGALRKRPDSYRVAKSDQYGRFQISGLTPGEYTIVATQDSDEDYRDPEFLKRYHDGNETVRLAQGEDKNISLKLQTASEN